MNILVTGGAGFIGSFIVDTLIQRGHTVRIFDNLDPQIHHQGQRPAYLNPEAEFIEGDVRDYDALAHAMRDANIIFHQAAAVGVGQSQYMIKHYVDVNTGGTANLLDILVNKKHRVQKLIVAASMSSYGEGKYHCEACGDVSPALRTEEQMASGDWELHCPHCQQAVLPCPTDERKVLASNSIYAISKKDQEEMCLTIGKAYDIPTVALRYFNVYGPRQSLSNPYTGVAAIFLSRIKNHNTPYVYEDGLQTRDFISVHDIVQANMLAMEKDAANYEMFNVGTGSPISIKDIAIRLAALYGEDISPQVSHTFRKGDVRYCYADIEKIKHILGFSPQVSFDTGMEELISWSYNQNAVDYFKAASDKLKEKGLI